MYDMDFTFQLRQVNPSWFVMPSDLVSQKKEELLRMAREGKPRLNAKFGLGKCLSHYVFCRGRSYDAEFDSEIRRIAPHWFKKGRKANPSLK